MGAEIPTHVHFWCDGGEEVTCLGVVMHGSTDIQECATPQCAAGDEGSVEDKACPACQFC